MKLTLKEGMYHNIRDKVDRIRTDRKNREFKKMTALDKVGKLGLVANLHGASGLAHAAAIPAILSGSFKTWGVAAAT